MFLPGFEQFCDPTICLALARQMINGSCMMLMRLHPAAARSHRREAQDLRQAELIEELLGREPFPRS